MIDFLQNIVDWLENIGTAILTYFENAYQTVSMVWTSVALIKFPLYYLLPIAPILTIASAMVGVAVLYKILGSR